MRSRWLLLASAAYALALVLIGLWRTPVDQNVAVTSLAPVVWLRRLLDLDVHQSYVLVEALANVALFVPLGVLVLLWRPGWGWLASTAVALGATVAIEVLQQALRPERFASIDDVVANTAGGAIGGLLVVTSRAIRR